MAGIISYEQFVEKSKLAHNDYYDYSLSKATYQGSSLYVTITCPTHGIFEQRAYEHMQGSRCYMCSGSRGNTPSFIRKANIIHSNKYSYEKSIYKTLDIVLIVTCPIHGDFKIKPRQHLYGARKSKDKKGVCHGCRKCGDNQKDLNAKLLFQGYGDLPLLFFNRIKTGCKRKSKELDFCITIEDMWNLFEKQKRRCALTKLPIKIVNSNDSHHTASLDRIDSNKGYLIDNIQWLHKDVNRMKMNFSQEYFIKICKLISKNAK